MKDVPYPLHVEHRWAGLPLHVADEIEVVLLFKLRLECDINASTPTRWDYSLNRSDVEAVKVFRSDVRVLLEREGHRELFQIFQQHALLVLSSKKQRSEIHLAHVEDDCWLLN